MKARAAALALMLGLTAPAAARTVVSLTFDDGTPTHLTARDILDQRGLKATFYINSGRVGDTPAYLTLEQVRSLAASGHEIGGHTIDHLDLTTLSTTDLRRQVCDDRAALIGLGFPAPVTLAYPFGASNSAVQAMARECGYTQARIVGGLSCANCPRAESLPPDNAFEIMTPDSVKDTTTLAALKKMVTDAEQAGGGWVPIVLHLVCDGCGTYSITPANLAAFADWLKDREASGTVVLPMGQALGAPAPDPAPSLAALAPSSAPAGGAAFALTVDGSGFVSGAAVLWNGSVRTTTFVGSTRLRASILAADLAAEGSASVTVRNPDGKVSGARSFVVYSTAPPLPPGAGFSDSFTLPDGLITNQNGASPRSPKWVVANGSLFASGGRGWTGVPDGVTPNAGSTNGTGSAYFRALSVPSDISSEVRARVTVQSFVSVRAVGNWDGAHFFLRYLDANNYYQVSIRRRDGRAAIKKRRNGTESTFTTPLYTAPALGTPQNARAIAVNNATGTVTIQLFMEGKLVASATDASSPFLSPGKAGMAGENTQFYFDDFSADGSSAPAGPPPAPAPTLASLSPSSAPAGTAGLTLLVAGSGFVSSSTVRWNGAARATVFVSSGLLQAQVPPADLQAPATASVTVFTPAPGGGTSAALPFLVVSTLPAPGAPTVVSLTFDDGWADQTLAAQLLGERGLKGTFNIISGRVGSSPSYLTRAQLEQVAAGGHEIAGHSLTHPDLTTLASSQLQSEVCGDRSQLLSWGFGPVSFAYPYGAENAAVRDMVRLCGYRSGRDVDGLSCSTCPRAESIPPADPFAIRTHYVSSGTSLARMQQMVTAAEGAGGGWVPIVFHQVCDGCAPYATSPATLAAFLDWLLSRQGRGTVVRTVAEVIGAPPPPSLTALSPSAAAAGGPGLTLAVGGLRFTPSTVVEWNGAPRATTFVSASTLTAAITALDLASAATAQVTASGPAGRSNALPFVVSPAPPPPPWSGFADSFTLPDGLITNQNGASPRSPKWVVSNGSLFASGGRGWTGVPDGVTPNAGSTNGTGSAYFRALSVPSDISSEVRARVTVQGFVSVRAIGNTNGAHFFLRYLDANNYYQVSIRRRDGRAAIKKRRNGAESTFTTPLYTMPALGTPQNARAIAVNNATGTVTIQLFMEGKLVASATDASNPFLSPGKAGMAGENTQFYFDDFSADGSSVPAGPPPAPAPVASALSPSSAPAGTAGLTLTVAGSGFVSSSTVRWNGAERATVFVNAGQLQAQVPPSDLLAPATAAVTVFTPAPGGGTSAALSFLVVSTAPTPAISGLTPASAQAGSAGFTLTVDGSGFASGSTVRWNGSARTTTFVSSGRLQASILAGDVASAGSRAVTVRNPDGAVSGAWSFQVSAPPPPSASTVVSLTFDDGSADQLNALRLLDERGLKGTFYINSALIGESGFYLTLSQLRSIAASGHEIGGHSRTHPYLTGLSQAQLQDEVCGDRAQLQAWGFSPSSFAYPYAADNAAVRDMARSCGYESGRDVGGIGSAESMPPADAYLIRTHASVEQTDSLSVLQQRVTAAEDAGGGWVPIVMHRVCSGCGQFSMTEATLAGFLDWLVARRSRGTAVMTVHEVMSGGAPPPAAPSISSLSPASALAGGPAFTLTVDGAGFAGGASVLWNGAARPTTFVSSTRVQAAIPASDIAAAGGANVEVSVPGAGTTTSVAFTVSSPGTPPPSGALFADSFDRPNALITNEYAYWNPTDPAAVKSPDWTVTAGSFFVDNGTAWTGVPDGGAPNAASSNATGSAVFRAATKRTDFGDAAVSFTLVNQGFVSASPAQAYDGVRLALRYLGESSYYELSLNRRDNTAVVKKRSGTALSTLASTSYAAPLGVPQSASCSARNNADGSVTVTLSLGGRQLLSVVDASSPLRAAGALALRADNVNFRVDDLSVQALGTSSALSATGLRPGASGPAGTVVSLTFDDGAADQMNALRLLDERGLKGTFYINSSMIGQSGYYLTLSQLRSIAASGHEIGGHSRTHPYLTSLSQSQLQDEVCGDRAQLQAWGFSPRSFAYPYAADNAAVRDMARSCGYESGRDVGGIGSAESIPPADAYLIRTHASVEPTDSLSVLQQRVTAAEDAGGGWVPIVMHRVCSGCGQFSMTEATLASFLDWLRARESRGTVVRTVAQVMAEGGAPPPQADAPSPATGESLDAARFFPNPWRADRHAGLPVTIDGLPPGSTVRLFTASGRWLRTIDAPAGVGRWDLVDDGGRRVASGLYLYLAVDPGGGLRRGVLAVLR